MLDGERLIGVRLFGSLFRLFGSLFRLFVLLGSDFILSEYCMCACVNAVSVCVRL